MFDSNFHEYSNWNSAQGSDRTSQNMANLFRKQSADLAEENPELIQKHNDTVTTVRKSHPGKKQFK